MINGLAPQRLVVLDPPRLRGLVLPVPDGWSSVGRGQVELRVDDPYVSRRHAALHAQNGVLTVEDVGSQSGTTLNGRRLQGREWVQPGDVLGFGPVTARYEAKMAAAPPAGPSFVVGSQSADILSNVAGNQYNSYLHTVIQQRESFFRQVAAARTRARRLILFGLFLFAAGSAVEIVGAVIYARSLTSANENTSSSTLFKGFDLAFAAGGVAAFGLILMIVGIILHISAASRQRRVDEIHPIRPPY
jgi:hypothetical protein